MTSCLCTEQQMTEQNHSSLQGTEHHHEPVPVNLLADATVADLKRRIERTNLHGQTVGSPPTVSCLKCVTEDWA